jgi:hypothetical protein
MNGKGDGSNCGINEETSRLFPGEAEENQQKLKMSGNSAEIQTEPLLNRSLGFYFYVCRLDSTQIQPVSSSPNCLATRLTVLTSTSNFIGTPTVHKENEGCDRQSEGYVLQKCVQFVQLL